MGAYCSLSEPTADTEKMVCTPSIFIAKTFARKFSSDGSSGARAPWRGRNATRLPSSSPTTIASEGWPNGVSTVTSCPVKPSIS